MEDIFIDFLAMMKSDLTDRDAKRDLYKILHAIATKILYEVRIADALLKTEMKAMTSDENIHMMRQ